MAKLIGVSGDFNNREFPLSEGDNTIGRKADNSVLVDSPLVSSHHAVIVIEGSSATVQDLDSTNGVRVNSRQVQTAPLHHKDIVQLGSLEFLFDAPEISSADIPARYTDADAEIATAAMNAPADFNNISPFGARPRERMGTWYFINLIMAICALLALGYFVYQLLQ